ncbi:MAG: hypothetical protein R3E66_06680 [bacterium]
MSKTNHIVSDIERYLPPYLTPEDRAKLWSELKSFPENMNFYLQDANLRDELLQGDGWRGLVVTRFNDGEQKTVLGMILSNSCDISAENDRCFPTNILFAPVVKLSRIAERLGEVKNEQQVTNILDNIRKQRVTSLFFLPSGSGLEESVIFLDDIHSHPLQHFLDNKRDSVFTLTQYAFYLLLMKLSIHFSRFQEGIRRFDDPE